VSDSTISDEVLSRLVAAADRAEIIENLSRYHHIIDSADWDSLPEIFSEDARSSVVRRSSDKEETLCELDGLTQIHDWLAEVNKRPFRQHYMNNHVFTLLDSDAAATRSYLSVRDKPIGGIYEADHVRTPKGWRIKRLALLQYTGT
jgi:SnoaL-like domain